MISPADRGRIRCQAYIPEHLVGLMSAVSGGDAFVARDYLGFAKDPWVILIGYPLAGGFAAPAFGQAMAEVLGEFRPASLWFIAPEVPAPPGIRITRLESDRYYTLDLEGCRPRSSLRRLTGRAARDLSIERGRVITSQHEEAITEFLTRERPSPRIEGLFRSMGRYMAQEESSVVLTARDAEGAVSAFYVVDLEAAGFATYVVGCHSKLHYVVGASDLLFLEMVALAREQGKRSIHLGLGVSDGIRRFKEKWGGVPGLPYESCEVRRRGVEAFLPLVARLWGR
jgi:hypothetical protein